MMSTIGLVVSLPPGSSSSEKADGHLSGFLPLRSGIFCLSKSNQLPCRMNDHSLGGILAKDRLVSGVLTPHCKSARNVEGIGGSSAGVTAMRCGAGINLLIVCPYVLLIKETLATCYKVSAVCSHRCLTAEHFNHPLSREQAPPIPSYPQVQVSLLLSVWSSHMNCVT